MASALRAAPSGVDMLSWRSTLRKAALDTDIKVGGTIQGYGVKFNPPGHAMAGQNALSSFFRLKHPVTSAAQPINAAIARRES